MRMQKPLTHRKKEKEKHFPLTLNKKRPLMQDYKKRAMRECSHAHTTTTRDRERESEKKMKGNSMLRDMHSKQIEKGECSYAQGDTHTQLSSLEATGHAQDLKRVEKRGCKSRECHNYQRG